MPSKRVSLKGKGAELFFGDYTPPIQSLPDTVAEDSLAAVDAPEVTSALTQPDEHSMSTAPATPMPSRRSPRQVSQHTQTASPVAASNGASKLASTLASVPSEAIRAIRKVVKVPGKEVSFVRLTPEEKAQVADIVYTYKRQGQKTTENEINRIALNHLLLDYHEHGEQSVLTRVLAALRD